MLVKSLLNPPSVGFTSYTGVCVCMCVYKCVCACVLVTAVMYSTALIHRNMTNMTKKCDVFEFKEECNFTWGLALTDPVSH